MESLFRSAKQPSVDLSRTHEALLGLPPEIWAANVFPRLKMVQDIRSARLVCKTWSAVILFPRNVLKVDVNRAENLVPGKRVADQCLKFAAKCKFLQKLEMRDLSLSSAGSKASNTLHALSLLGGLASLRSLTLVGRKGDYKFHRSKAAPLPSSFSQLQALESLHLEFMWIVDDVKAVANMRSLRSLTIKCCNIQEIPQDMDKLPLLRSLMLSCVACCPKDASVDLQAITLPDFSSGFLELEDLTLHRIPFLTHLPTSIASLAKLERLDISLNRDLEDLPSEMAKAPSLKVVKLIGCNKLLKDVALLKQVLPNWKLKLYSLYAPLQRRQAL